VPNHSLPVPALYLLCSFCLCRYNSLAKGDHKAAVIAAFGAVEIQSPHAPRGSSDHTITIVFRRPSSNQTFLSFVAPWRYIFHPWPPAGWMHMQSNSEIRPVEVAWLRIQTVSESPDGHQVSRMLQYTVETIYSPVARREHREGRLSCCLEHPHITAEGPVTTRPWAVSGRLCNTSYELTQSASSSSESLMLARVLLLFVYCAHAPEAAPLFRIPIAIFTASDAPRTLL
jgi:hypothetical protein